MIKLENVNVKYIKDFYSVYNINFAISDNTVLLGDKTSGNNFVLRLLSKIDKNYDGNILIDNKNLKEIKDKDLNLSYIPKENYFFKNKTVLENLIYPLKIKKMDKNNAKNTAISLINQYKLENFYTNYNLFSLTSKEVKKKKTQEKLINFENLKVKSLDFSTQKIIALLRAVIRKPKYILIENLFENLDEKYHDLASQIILNATKNSTIIATEKTNKNIDCYKNFKTITFDSGSLKI